LRAAVFIGEQAEGSARAQPISVTVRGRLVSRAASQERWRKA
jgi:hypothetical protein